MVSIHSEDVDPRSAPTPRSRWLLAPHWLLMSYIDRAVRDLPPSVVEFLVLRSHLRDGDTRMRAVPLADAAAAGNVSASSDVERQVYIASLHRTRCGSPSSGTTSLSYCIAIFG